MPGKVSVGHAACAFGPYELDLRAGELRREGRSIRLQEQPFQILRMLVEAPGEVLLRDEIRLRLWPNQTVVEFDHSINAAVNRLRAALRDSAHKPRYIETVGRRGYRFISPVRPNLPQPVAPAHAGSERGAVSATVMPSIAVLPFTNLSGDSNRDNEYFSDGLTEEIINRLAHIPGVKVIARTSAFAFKGKQDDIRNIGATLGATNILEGSVRRIGTRVRILAQLITVTDGTHLWSESYDRELSDIFAIHDEIAHASASALRVQLTGVQLIGMTSQYTPRLPAYEAYLRARHYMAAMTRKALARSRESYEQAIALDSGFASAHSGLAFSLLSSVLPGILPGREALPLARAAAERALCLDPRSQEAQAVIGTVAAVYDFDWDRAEVAFQIALAREPVPPYVRWYAAFSYLFPLGRFGECAVQCILGLKDDPLNFIGAFQYAGGLLASGDDDGGEKELRELCELHPSLYQPFYLLGLTKALQGAHSEALANAEIAYSLAPWNTGAMGLLAGALDRTGDTKRAEDLLHQLMPCDRNGTAMGLLLFHLVRSDLDRAADWGWKVLAERDTRLIYILGLLRSPSRNVLRSNRTWSALASSLRIPLVG